MCVHRLEDGTVPFLGIVALERGFQTLSRLGGLMPLVEERTFTLARCERLTRWINDSYLFYL